MSSFTDRLWESSSSFRPLVVACALAIGVAVSVTLVPDQWRLAVGSRTADGEVLSAVVCRGFVVCRADVTWVTPDDRSVVHRIPVDRGDEVGDGVAVRFDPDDPQNASAQGLLGRMMTAVALIAIGPGVTVIAGWTLVVMFRRHRRERAAGP